jgi:hypothetical protein
MALQGTQPDNKSFLSPIGFRFSCNRLPHVNYFCTAATIPDISLGETSSIDNPFIKLPVPGDKLTFGRLDLTFRVDEDMKNFQEIYNWLTALGYPDNFNQRAAIGRTQTSVGDVYSDGSLMVTTANMKPNIEIAFVDMYPSSLSSLEFDIENTDVEYLKATVSFAYRKYSLTTLS